MEWTEKVREITRNKTFEISGTAIENMVRTYAEHVVDMETLIEQTSDDYWEGDDCPEWMCDDGYKSAMERWLRLIGINENSPYVRSFIEEERKERYDNTEIN